LLLSFGNSTGKNSSSKLTRVHFHYLLYHIVALTDNDLWSNTDASLIAGSKVASKQACDYDYHENESEDFSEKVFFKFGTKKFEIEKDNFLMLNSSNPILKFKRNSIYFYLTPVLVCKKPLRTVGLGDAISSTGLFFAKFNQ
jgi:ADP-dependent glucokinase